MASVVARVFGHHPAFLTSGLGRRNLYQLLATARAPVGLRVVPSSWFNRGVSDSYFEVERVAIDRTGKSGRAYGTRVWRGRPDSKPMRIPGGTKHSWHVYESRESTQQLERKLGLKA